MGRSHQSFNKSEKEKKRRKKQKEKAERRAQRKLEKEQNGPKSFEDMLSYVDENGNYEYKFRVMYSENSETTNIFDGDYTVKLFKVVYLNDFI